MTWETIEWHSPKRWSVASDRWEMCNTEAEMDKRKIKWNKVLNSPRLNYGRLCRTFDTLMVMVVMIMVMILHGTPVSSRYWSVWRTDHGLMILNRDELMMERERERFLPIGLSERPDGWMREWAAQERDSEDWNWVYICEEAKFMCVCSTQTRD